MKNIITWLSKIFQRKPNSLLPNVKQPAKSIANDLQPVKPDEQKCFDVTDIYHSDRSIINQKLDDLLGLNENETVVSTNIKSIKKELIDKYNIKTDRDLIKQLNISDHDKDKLFTWIKLQCAFSYRKGFNDAKDQ